MRGTQTGKPDTTLLGPGSSSGFAPQCPAQPGWHGALGNGRHLTAELVEKADAFQVSCVVALSC